MSPTDVAQVISTRSSAQGPARLLVDNEGRFGEYGNRQSFAFQHTLANHPLFSIEALRGVAARIPKYEGFVGWQNGKIAVSDSWGTNTAKRLSLDETIAGIADNDSLVILKHAEQDEVIGPVLGAVLTEIVDLSPPEMRDDVTIGESIIFINSPGRVTKYHLDLEANYLLQVRGRKTVHVFDQTDRSIVPHEEVEAQCCGNHDAAIFKPERQEAARTYLLEPGDGVHFPSTAPHWVLNGEGVSISININFELRSVHHRLRSIHRFNRRLRRYGLAPTPPGQNTAIDEVKASLENGLALARRVLRPATAMETYPIWTPRVDRTSSGVRD